jgi:hypothetical protein
MTCREAIVVYWVEVNCNGLIDCWGWLSTSWWKSCFVFWIANCSTFYSAERLILLEVSSSIEFAIFFSLGDSAFCRWWVRMRDLKYTFYIGCCSIEGN